METNKQVHKYIIKYNTEQIMKEKKKKVYDK